MPLFHFKQLKWFLCYFAQLRGTIYAFGFYSMQHFIFGMYFCLCNSSKSSSQSHRMHFEMLVTIDESKHWIHRSWSFSHAWKNLDFTLYLLHPRHNFFNYRSLTRLRNNWMYSSCFKILYKSYQDIEFPHCCHLSSSRSLSSN